MYQAFKHVCIVASFQRDCTKEIEWFKDVKESQGSVAESAFKLMEALNSRYGYVIKSGESAVAQEINDVLSVQLRPEHHHARRDEGKLEMAKVYTLEELCSLESRLVLIGGNYGKGQQEIKTFVEVSLNFMMVKVFFLCLLACTIPNWVLTLYWFLGM